MYAYVDYNFHPEKFTPKKYFCCISLIDCVGRWALYSVYRLEPGYKLIYGIYGHFNEGRGLVRL